jgi:hypothetical protein
MFIKEVSWSSVVDAKLLWAVVVYEECRNVWNADLCYAAMPLENPFTEFSEMNIRSAPFNEESINHISYPYVPRDKMPTKMQ